MPPRAVSSVSHGDITCWSSCSCNLIRSSMADGVLSNFLAAPKANQLSWPPKKRTLARWRSNLSPSSQLTSRQVHALTRNDVFASSERKHWAVAFRSILVFGQNAYTGCPRKVAVNRCARFSIGMKLADFQKSSCEWPSISCEGSKVRTNEAWCIKT